MSRPKHPRKELEALLKEAEAKGWRVVKGSKYLELSIGAGELIGA